MDDATASGPDHMGDRPPAHQECPCYVDSESSVEFSFIKFWESGVTKEMRRVIYENVQRAEAPQGF
jgi:hypothetical protein